MRFRCEDHIQATVRSQKGEKRAHGVCNSCGVAKELWTRCKPCHKAVLKRWYDANPKRAYDAKLRYKAKHPDRFVAQRKAYKQRPEVQLKERIRANIRYRTYVSTEGVFTVHDFTRLTVAQRGLCALCGEAKTLTIDHIVPVSKGGTNDPANVQLLCRPCNTRKMTKIMSGIAHKLVLVGVA